MIRLLLKVVLRLQTETRVSAAVQVPVEHFEFISKINLAILSAIRDVLNVLYLKSGIVLRGFS